MSGSDWAVFACSRLARALVSVLVVAAIAWCLVEVAPGSTAERAARAAGLLSETTDMAPDEKAAIVDQVARQRGLDRPLSTRIGRYIVNLVSADLGETWRDGQPVSARIGPAAVATFALLAASFAVACVFGLGLAVLAAERKGTGTDVAISVAVAVAVSVPLSWLGMLALRTFAAGRPFEWFGLVGLGALPVVTLAAIPGAVIARHARAALVEAAGQPWAVAARARGATTRRVIAVHALMASLPSLLALVPALVGYMLGASLVVERVFGIRGLGWLVTDAAARGDAPVIVGVSVVAAAVLGLSSAATELLSRAIDPREAGDA